MGTATSDYLDLLNQVPQDMREELGTRLRKNPRSYEDVLDSSQEIVAALVQGNLPPGVAKEAHRLLQLQMQLVAAKEQRALGGPAGEDENLIVALFRRAGARAGQLPGKPVTTIEATYTSDVPEQLAQPDDLDVVGLERTSATLRAPGFTPPETQKADDEPDDADEDEDDLW